MSISAQQANKLLDEAELIFTEAQIQTALHEVAEQIKKVMRDKHPILLSVMGGAVVFSGQLLPLLDFPLDFDYVHVSRYGDARHGGVMKWKVEPGENVRGRIVLLLDDILDEGHTLKALSDKVMALGAVRCYCAVLADKQHDRPKPIRADFAGLQVPNRFIFGYGMDIQGAWRNLPAIYAVKEN